MSFTLVYTDEIDKYTLDQLIHSFTHTHAHPLTHPLTQPFTHKSTHPLNHSHTHPLTHPLEPTHSGTALNKFTAQVLQMLPSLISPVPDAQYT